MIGVAGATGSVGRWAVRELSRMGVGPLRLGGRQARTLAEVATKVAGAEVHPFDLEDAQGTARFCAGCTVVLNCAGPSYLILDTLARAAAASGAAYVNVSGDEPVHRRLCVSGGAGTAVLSTAVLSAGMLPGLSALLPRWMAGGLDGVDWLSCYVGGLERCSPSSATDMILSMQTGDGEDYGQALAGWRHGRVEPRVLRPAKDVDVPFFPDPVSTHPFLSGESARLGASLGAGSLDFWNVFVGDRLVNAFTRMRTRPPQGEGLTSAVQELTRAAELDLFGRKPYYALVFEMGGELDGSAVVRTAALRTGDAYALIAAVAALAVRAVVEGRVEPGMHYAAEVLDPEWSIQQLRHSTAVDVLEVVDRVAGGPAADEGAL